MRKSDDLERAIIDDIKFGALAVMNKVLYDIIQKSQDFEKWPAEEKAKFFLIRDVEGEILRRVDQTLNPRRRKK